MTLYQSFAPFKGFELKVIKILHMYAEKTQLRRREFLIREKDRIQGIYLLTQGSVRVIFPSIF